MMDPPRAEREERRPHVPATPASRPVMITGDHPLTARRRSRPSLASSRRAGSSSARELEAMSDDDLERQVPDDRRLRAGLAGRQACAS